ncbi:MAG TPA: hypothetical protein ENO05_11710 [Bacteroides sp.]|nr:hypothetical protein [Bacteroides sp.]
MPLSLHPEMRPDLGMRMISIDEVIALGERIPGEKPALEHYFSPSRRENFIGEYLHYLNTWLLEARHGNLDSDLYLVFVLSFQFTAPLLEIPAEKELGIFCRILEKNYGVVEPDLNLHFNLENQDERMVGEEEAMETYREELRETYHGSREVKDSVQKRLKRDAIEAIMRWQKEQSLPELAAAFGRSIVIPSFFSFVDKKLVGFYKRTTEGISYMMSIPEELI